MCENLKSEKESLTSSYKEEIDLLKSKLKHYNELNSELENRVISLEVQTPSQQY